MSNAMHVKISKIGSNVKKLKIVIQLIISVPRCSNFQIPRTRD
jgi:hypothetical protein